MFTPGLTDLKLIFNIFGFLLHVISPLKSSLGYTLTISKWIEVTDVRMAKFYLL